MPSREERILRPKTVFSFKASPWRSFYEKEYLCQVTLTGIL
jgi:hypothetical protein